MPEGGRNLQVTAVPQWHEKSAALPTSSLTPRFSPELFICGRHERGCPPCKEIDFPWREERWGVPHSHPGSSGLPDRERREEDALAGMQDQSGPAQRSSPAAGGPGTAPAGDAQAPKELLRARDVVNKGGHASDFYL